MPITVNYLDGTSRKSWMPLDLPMSYVDIWMSVGKIKEIILG